MKVDAFSNESPRPLTFRFAHLFAAHSFSSCEQGNQHSLNLKLFYRSNDAWSVQLSFAFTPCEIRRHLFSQVPIVNRRRNKNWTTGEKMPPKKRTRGRPLSAFIAEADANTLKCSTCGFAAGMSVPNGVNINARKSEWDGTMKSGTFPMTLENVSAIAVRCYRDEYDNGRIHCADCYFDCYGRWPSDEAFVGGPKKTDPMAGGVGVMDLIAPPGSATIDGYFPVEEYVKKSKAGTVFASAGGGRGAKAAAGRGDGLDAHTTAQAAAIAAARKAEARSSGAAAAATPVVAARSGGGAPALSYAAVAAGVASPVLTVGSPAGEDDAPRPTDEEVAPSTTAIDAAADRSDATTTAAAPAAADAGVAAGDTDVEAADDADAGEPLAATGASTESAPSRPTSAGPPLTPAERRRAAGIDESAAGFPQVHEQDGLSYGVLLKSHYQGRRCYSIVHLVRVGYSHYVVYERRGTLGEKGTSFHRPYNTLVAARAAFEHKFWLRTENKWETVCRDVCAFKARPELYFLPFDMDQRRQAKEARLAAEERRKRDETARAGRTIDPTRLRDTLLTFAGTGTVPSQEVPAAAAIAQSHAPSQSAADVRTTSSSTTAPAPTTSHDAGTQQQQQQERDRERKRERPDEERPGKERHHHKSDRTRRHERSSRGASSRRRGSSGDEDVPTWMLVGAIGVACLSISVCGWYLFKK
jgi:hypothetical protein